jgi:hypothetical protein
MRALVICDKVEPILYSSGIKRHVGEVDLIISCGDLPHYYLEYVMTMLGRQVYYVNGNHARDVEYQAGKGDNWQAQSEPMGAINLHRRTAREGALLMAGLEGSIRYNRARCGGTSTIWPPGCSSTAFAMAATWMCWWPIRRPGASMTRMTARTRGLRVF